MDKINEKTTLEDVLERPGSDVILAKYKVPCLSCPMAEFEIQRLTIGDVCKMYKINLKGMLEDLNQKNNSLIKNK